mmetsp:Transcript_8464/g.20795  ORF Transcript_8464/g.20795 Transcript_8464/m.20795 type:complete len:234 (+) Transcript_8464:351-1052(+)
MAVKGRAALDEGRKGARSRGRHSVCPVVKGRVVHLPGPSEPDEDRGARPKRLRRDLLGRSPIPQGRKRDDGEHEGRRRGSGQRANRDAARVECPRHSRIRPRIHTCRVAAGSAEASSPCRGGLYLRQRPRLVVPGPPPVRRPRSPVDHRGGSSDLSRPERQPRGLAAVLHRYGRRGRREHELEIAAHTWRRAFLSLARQRTGSLAIACRLSSGRTERDCVAHFVESGILARRE